MTPDDLDDADVADAMEQMSERDKRLVDLIDRVAQSGQSDEDRAYLVASLAYGNVKLAEPRPASSEPGPGDGGAALAMSDLAKARREADARPWGVLLRIPPGARSSR